MMHKVSQDAAQTAPAGAHSTSLSRLCSAPLAMFFTHPHSYGIFGMCLAYTYISAQGHVRSMAKDTEGPSYACHLRFLQPLSWHKMYLLVCKRVYVLWFLRKSHSSFCQRQQLH